MLRILMLLLGPTLFVLLGALAVFLGELYGLSLVIGR